MILRFSEIIHLMCRRFLSLYHGQLKQAWSLQLFEVSLHLQYEVSANFVNIQFQRDIGRLIANANNVFTKMQLRWTEIVRQ